MPIKNAGPAICRDQARAICQSNPLIILLIKVRRVYNAPNRIKIIPPTISYFHDIMIIINNKSGGMLCINRPKIVPQNPKFISKMSSENIVKKRTNKRDNILGVQYMNLLIFFT